MTRRAIFTCEAVTDGHPDKLCDQISDALVDRFLVGDPQARIVAECAVATGVVFVAAKFSAAHTVDIPEVARAVIEQAGYVSGTFNARSCSILTNLVDVPRGYRARQDERDLSEAEIDRVPADDQVTVFGFACRQTPQLMPLPVVLAQDLARRIGEARRSGEIAYLQPDGKVQVSVEYEDRQPRRIAAIALTTAIDTATAPNALRQQQELQKLVIAPVFQEQPIAPDRDTDVVVNPGDPFDVGGPARHAGLTGRKTAADTYGNYARHGAAALSGKDPTRIDRTSAYAARYAAKNVVAAELADDCEVQLSYAIGRTRPVSLQVECFGTARIPEERIATLIEQHIDLRPAGIIRSFDLRGLPKSRDGHFYQPLAACGHFGRSELDLPWERTDLVQALADAAAKT
jgi:S-adenosylmethionine synthetase